MIAVRTRFCLRTENGDCVCCDTQTGVAKNCFLIGPFGPVSAHALSRRSRRVAAAFASRFPCFVRGALPNGNGWQRWRKRSQRGPRWTKRAGRATECPAVPGALPTASPCLQTPPPQQSPRGLPLVGQLRGAHLLPAQYTFLRLLEAMILNVEYIEFFAANYDPKDAYCAECLSDDLDKLSTCLSEVSSEEDNPKKNGVVQDLVQAQLAFWTLVFSLLYSYAWQQHRKKFLLTLLVSVPVVLIVCFTIAWLLGTIVVLSRIFSTSIWMEQMLKFGQTHIDDGSRRRRSISNVSRRSSVSCSGRSSSCEELPKPVCRKHSSSNSSLNLVHVPATNGFAPGSGAVSPSGRRTPNSPPTRKLSYAFTHHTAEDDEVLTAR